MGCDDVFEVVCDMALCVWKCIYVVVVYIYVNCMLVVILCDINCM